MPPTTKVEISERNDVNNVAAFLIEVVVPNAPPEAASRADIDADEGELITFSGSFFDPDLGEENPTDTHTILWDFGDGETAEETLIPTHAYGDEGEFTVTLTVTDSYGESDSDTLVVTVFNAPPDTVFSFGPLGDFEPEEGQLVTFDASGMTDTGSGDTIVSYVWDFGDGSSATGQDRDPHLRQ